MIYYNYYADQRLKISKGIFALNDKHLADTYRAHVVGNIIANLPQNATTPGNPASYDHVRNNMKFYKYSVISIMSPCYAEKETLDKAKTDNATLKSYWEHEDGKHGKESKKLTNYSPMFAFVPDMRFCRPPRCNVVTSNKSDNLSINYGGYKITRLLNRYVMFQDIEIDSVAYPSEVETGRQENKQNRDRVGLTNYEKRYGMVPTHNDKVGPVYMALANAVRLTTGRKTNEEDLNYVKNFIKADTMHDFFGQRYTDQIEVSMPVFRPDIVAGLPGMIYDEETNQKYYGMINSVILRVDQSSESGGVGTTIRMSNVLSAKYGSHMLEDAADVANLKVDENELPISPFIDKEMFGKANNLDKLYAALLGDTSFDYNSTKALPRVPKIRKIITYDQYLDIKGVKGNTVLKRLLPGHYDGDVELKKIDGMEDYIKGTTVDLGGLEKLRNEYGHRNI